MVTIDRPDMTCKELVELVTDYLEGALSPVERARFEEHMDGCEACVRYLQQMRQTIRTLGNLPAEGISTSAMSVLLDHFRKRN